MVLFFSDMISRCLQAESKTRERQYTPVYIDTGMLWPMMRCFFLCTLLPSLAYPLGILHAYGYLRCLATTSWTFRKDLPVYTEQVNFGAFRREYNKEKGRITEIEVTQDPEQFAHAKLVVGSKRNEYVTDPGDKHVSYFLIEQRTLSARAFLQGEKYAWTLLAEFLRFGGAALVCYVFLPAARRFHADIPQYFRGQLGFSSIRHPIPNFFLSVEDYNKAKHRINARMPKESRPWNYKL